MPLEQQVSWYPGHMAKAARRMRELLQLIDVVVEVVDARIVRSGRNPLLDELAARRARVVALTRDDLAEPKVTKRWLAELAGCGYAAVAVDARSARSVARVAALVTQASPLGARTGGILRAMVVGIPNSGKSSIINAILKRSAARTEDRAGVTRHMQWFRLARNAELVDTPGVLPPKISGAGAQWKLALCGAVPQDRYDPQEVAAAFHRWLRARGAADRAPDLEAFAAQRGFLRRHGETDYHNAALSYVRAFNDGAFGRISLEDPGDAEAA
ncbi:MAG TPA: ribosome biogenesis GTPase YlqF [Candidatus Nitrosotalea sp.]|nr:ribosome biogenesis GTPase YlqF [Candidatus Nitrosotalea sp.]